ncbi:MAG: hypothetical protein AABW72_04255 [archaeon]
MDALINIRRASQSLDLLDGAIRNKGWADLNREQLVEELKKVEAECSRFSDELKKAVEKTKEHGSIDHINLDEYFKELNKTLEILKRNIEMEEKVTETTKFHIANVYEKESIPELYNELQQRMFSVLLKGRFILERLEIAAQKHDNSQLEKKPLARRLLDTLEEKDNELNKVREEYEQLRVKSFLGLVKERTVAELESTLNENNAELERRIADFDNRYRMIIQKVIMIQKELIHLSRDKNVMEHLLSKYMRNSREVILELKKERDYANKVLMEIENDTSKIREKYMSNLLNIDKEKIAIKEEVGQNYEQRINVLRQRLIEKDELIEHLRKIATRKEKAEIKVNAKEEIKTNALKKTKKK